MEEKFKDLTKEQYEKLSEKEQKHISSQFRLNDDSGLISGKQSGYDRSLTPEESKARIKKISEELLKGLADIGYGGTSGNGSNSDGQIEDEDHPLTRK